MVTGVVLPEGAAGTEGMTATGVTGMTLVGMFQKGKIMMMMMKMKRKRKRKEETIGDDEHKDGERKRNLCFEKWK